MSDHPTRDDLFDLALEALPEASARDVRAHVAECDECAILLSGLEEEQKVLAAALGRQPDEAAADAVAERVLGAVRAATPPKVVRAFRWRRFAAAAAGVLIALTAGLYLRQTLVVAPKQELIQRVRLSEIRALDLEEEVSK